MSMRATNKHNPWIAPEGYFESFPERLMTRIREEEAEGKRAAQASKTVPLWKRWAVAAAAVGVVAVASVGLLQTEPVIAESDAETLYEEEMLEYVTLHNVDIEYYLTQY